jgi:hypothetical protein
MIGWVRFMKPAAIASELRTAIGKSSTSCARIERSIVSVMHRHLDVTPVTDRTARYFYVNGAQRHKNAQPEKAALERVFAEDRTIIEAQQRNMDSTAGWRFMPTTADKGVILFNRLIEKLARDESARPSPAFQAGSAQK